MDAIVQQAMAKWPNVPHCYGWLMLDARGNWRMRDENAQAKRLPGERIAHAALLAFINRNYGADARGCWYFQNGPQRVYVRLEAAPFVARSDPQHEFLLHTGAAMPDLDAVWATAEGQFFLSGREMVAAVDDRDLVACVERLRCDGRSPDDDRLLAWLGDPSDAASLTMRWRHRDLPVHRIERDVVPSHFNFVTEPRPDAAHLGAG